MVAQRLPTEILLAVLGHVDDLLTLANVVQSSPVLADIFLLDSHAFLENTLRSNTTCWHTQHMICVTTWIRSGRLCAPDHLRTQNLLHLRYAWTHYMLKYQHRWHDFRLSPTWKAFVPHSVCRDATPKTIRGILATTARLVQLTEHCLEYYLQRLRATNPLHCHKGKHQFRRRAKNCQRWGCHHLYCSGAPFPQPVRVKDHGHPTWQEWQRVFRAFWRYQLVHDLQTSATCNHLEWPKDDVARLRCASPLEFWSFPARRGHHKNNYSIHPELAELETIGDYLRECHHRTWPVAPKISPACFSRKRVLDGPEPADWRALGNPSVGTLWHVTVTSESNHIESDDTNPRHSACPFTKLGIAFWSEERLRGHGLCGPSGTQQSVYWGWFYTFAWLSILGGVAKVETMHTFKGPLWSGPVGQHLRSVGREVSPVSDYRPSRGVTWPGQLPPLSYQRLRPLYIPSDATA